MTDAELREHLGEYVICTSKRCTSRGALTKLGLLTDSFGPGRGHDPRPALYTYSNPIRRNDTLYLTKPTPFVGPRERSELDALVYGIATASPVSLRHRIELTERVACWHCGQIKFLDRLKLRDIAS